MKHKILCFIPVICLIFLLAGCGEKSVTESYTEYLRNFADSSSEVYYLIRDIDNDGKKTGRQRNRKTGDKNRRKRTRAKKKPRPEKTCGGK